MTDIEPERLKARRKGIKMSMKRFVKKSSRELAIVGLILAMTVIFTLI